MSKMRGVGCDTTRDSLVQCWMAGTQEEQKSSKVAGSSGGEDSEKFVSNRLNRHQWYES